MRIHVDLLVALKGADLVASTAELTLFNKMNMGEKLAGVKRFDLYRFDIETGVDPKTAVANLKRVLDRQSTFYNRNKHIYELRCHWEGGSHSEGFARDDHQTRWIGELAKSLHSNGDRDSGGKDTSAALIFRGSPAYLVEVLVEDDDRTARDAVAARIRRDLSGLAETAGAKVDCHHRATLWWLVVAADDAGAAKEIAQHITVTERRDVGLLMNPNYQHAEFVSVEHIGPVSS